MNVALTEHGKRHFKTFEILYLLLYFLLLCKSLFSPKYLPVCFSLSVFIFSFGRFSRFTKCSKIRHLSGRKGEKNLYMKAKKNLSKEKWKYFVDFTFKMFENYLVELRLVRHSIMVQKQFRGPSQMFLKIGVLKNFTNLTGKQLCWSLFLIKSQAWSPAILLIETPTEMFSSVYCEIFKNSFFIEQSLWMLLDIFCKCSKV